MDNDSLSFHSCWHQWCAYLGPIENIDVADLCEVSPAAVTGWMNGSRRPRADKLKRIANFLYELMSEGKVVITPHNRKDFVTVCTTYVHDGEIPTAKNILDTLSGKLSVKQLLESDSNTLTEIDINNYKSSYRRRSVALAFGASLIIALVVFSFYKSTSQANPKFLNSTPILSLDDNIFRMRISPDGKQRAFIWQKPGSINFDIYLQTNNGEVTELITSPGYEVALAWSPSADAIAFLRYGSNFSCEILVFTLATKQETKVGACSFGPYGQIAWSRDGERLYYIHKEAENLPSVVQSLSLASLQVKTLSTPSETTVFGDYVLAESRDGKKIAYLRSDLWSRSQLRIYNVKTGQESAVYDFDKTVLNIDWLDDDSILAITGPSFNQIEKITLSGKRSLVSSRSRTITDLQINSNETILLRESLLREDIFLRNLNTDVVGDQKKTIVSSQRRDWLPVLSPNEQQLAFLSNRNGRVDIWISQADGSAAQSLTDGTIEGVSQLLWSPDGRKLLFNDNQDILFTLSLMSGKIEQYSPDNIVAKNPSWGGNSRRVYFSSPTKNQWDIWALDTANGQPRQVTHCGGVSARESTNGKYLYFSRMNHKGFWRIPLLEDDLNKDIAPELVVDHHIFTGAWTQWQLIDDKVFFAAGPYTKFEMFQYDILRQQKESLMTLPHSYHYDFTFHVTQDLKSAYYSERTRDIGEYILLSD